MNHPGLAYYVNLLSENVPFAFSRYGDGEWNTIFRRSGENCDGHKYFKDLSLALEYSLTLPMGNSFFSAMGPKALAEDEGLIWSWLVTRDATEIVWHDTEVFLDASIHGNLYPLIEVLRTQRIVAYIGPEHLRKFLTKELQLIHYIVIPDKDAWLSKDKVIPQIEKLIHSGVDTVGFSAGMATNGMIYELWSNQYRAYASGATLIDFGSVFDPYVGVKSRRYMREGGHDWQQLYRKNFKGE